MGKWALCNIFGTKGTVGNSIEQAGDFIHLVGSSRIQTDGLLINSKTIASRFCSPLDKFLVNVFLCFHKENFFRCCET